MLLAVGRGILYSSGTDLTLCSWQIDTLDEIAKVEVSLHWSVLTKGQFLNGCGSFRKPTTASLQLWSIPKRTWSLPQLPQ